MAMIKELGENDMPHAVRSIHGWVTTVLDHVVSNLGTVTSTRQGVIDWPTCAHEASAWRTEEGPQMLTASFLLSKHGTNVRCLIIHDDGHLY